MPRSRSTRWLKLSERVLRNGGVTLGFTQFSSCMRGSLDVEDKRRRGVNPSDGRTGFGAVAAKTGRVRSFMMSATEDGSAGARLVSSVMSAMEDGSVGTRLVSGVMSAMEDGGAGTQLMASVMSAMKDGGVGTRLMASVMSAMEDGGTGTRLMASVMSAVEDGGVGASMPSMTVLWGVDCRVPTTRA